MRDPQQLVTLQGTGKMWEGGISSQGGDVESYFSHPMYRNLRDKSSVFQSAAATSTISVAVRRHDSTTAEGGEIVSGNYFTTLGVQPAAGRLFTQSDDTAPGANPVAVLSYPFLA